MAITITKQPVNVTAALNEVIQFTVEAEGTGLTYQWEYFGGSKWVNHSSVSATSAELTFATKSYHNGYKYRCLITDANGNQIRTDEVTLTIGEDVEPEEPTDAIQITTQPENEITQVGTTAKFSVVAEGEGLTYQWEYNTGSQWVNNGNASATSAELTFTAKSYHNGYKYRCLITDANGNQIRTDEVTLTIGEDVEPTDAIQITTQPENETTPVGTTAKFSVVAEGEGLTYQWEYNTGSQWVNNGNASATTAELTFTARAYHNGYKYRCLITDANGNTLRTNEVTLSLFAITKQPEDILAIMGDVVTFTVEAVGNELSYQWQYMSAGSTKWIDWVSESAATSLFLLKINTDTRLTASYRCKITDANGNELYSNVVKIVSPTIVPVIQQPEIAKVGEAITFSIEAENISTYQWQASSNGGSSWFNVPWDGNTTATTGTTMNAQNITYLYRCIMTDTEGVRVITENISLTTPIVITKQPKNIKTITETTIHFIVEATGEELTYQWEYLTLGATKWINNTLEGNATANLTFKARDYHNGYKYRCLITNINGVFLRTNEVVLNTAAEAAEYNENIIITKQPKDFVATPNENYFFATEAEGEELTYQWQTFTNATTSWSNSTINGNTTPRIENQANQNYSGHLYRCLIQDSYGNIVKTREVSLTVSASYFYTPYFMTPESWQGRKITFSTWLKSEDWSLVDQGVSVEVCVGTPDMLRKRGFCSKIISVGGVFTEADYIKGETLENGKWSRVWVTYELTDDFLNEIHEENTSVNDCTTIQFRVYVNENGIVQFMKPKAEWGGIISDWSPAFEDVDLNEYAKIGDIPTDDYINSLIDAKLAAIPNAEEVGF